MLKRFNPFYFLVLILGSLINEVANAQQVTITNGANSSAYAPLNYRRPYSANEMIYLKNQIGQSLTINTIAYEKVAGTTVSPIGQVSIYMKHTNSNAFTAGKFDTTGYTRVYKGNFMNNAVSGWMTITLQTPYQYSDTANLQIMFLRKGTAIDSGAAQPQYRYGFTSNRNSSRRIASNQMLHANVNMELSEALSNIRFNFAGPTGLSESAAAPIINFYPNPVSDKLIIQCPDKIDLVQVTDATGKIMLEKEMVSPEKSLELIVSSLPAGFYVLQLTSEKSRFVRSFLKE